MITITALTFILSSKICLAVNPGSALGKAIMGSAFHMQCPETVHEYLRPLQTSGSLAFLFFPPQATGKTDCRFLICRQRDLEHSSKQLEQQPCFPPKPASLAPSLLCLNCKKKNPTSCLVIQASACSVSL